MTKQKYPNGLAEALVRRPEVSQKDLAEAASTSVQQINRFVHGERELTPSWAEKIAPLLRTSPEQLVFPDLRRVRAPVLSWVSAGKLTHHDGITKADIKKYILLDGLPKGDWNVLEVVGDSMDKLAPEGSLICVNLADKEPVNDKFYVFMEPSEGVTFKRYRAGRPPKLLPFSNAEHDPIIASEGLVIVGRVSRVILDLK